MTWILILAFASASTTHGQAIQSIPGFASEQACLVAGNAFIQQQRLRATGVTALCVRAS